MLPFERDILLQMVLGEQLKDADLPAEGWTEYARVTGAATKTKYNPNYRVLED